MPSSPLDIANRSARIIMSLGLSLVMGATASWALDPVVCIDEGIFVPPALAPDPVAVGGPVQGEVYEGATPPGLDPSRPVLVFVQGLHGSASDWRDDTEYYGHNDMYDAAYAAGYKTFFVDLYDATGEARTSIENGTLLKSQLTGIASYWGVDKVNVVAHSKGGPDSNVAAILGAPVDTVFSLGGAHWGSPLADLAQTSWLGWLADLLGFNDAGTRFLQTACMQLARNFLDSRPINSQLSFYTAAATGWGPFLSSLEFGGLYLAGACPGGGNDGLVCVQHAKHPWARDPQGAVTGEHRLIWDAGGPDFEADHDNVRMGNAFFDFTWPWEPDDCYVPIFDSIEPYIDSFNSGAALGTPAQIEAVPPRPLLSVLRGGSIEADGAQTSFPLESGASTLSVRVLVGHFGDRVLLRDASGRAYRLPPAQPVMGTVFRGAFSTGIEIDRPMAGDWRLELSSDRPSAFALMAVVDSQLDLRLVIESDAAGRRTVSVTGDAAQGVSFDAELRRVSTDRSASQETFLLHSDSRQMSIEPSRGGVYNLALTVSGEAAGIGRFERSAVVSLAVGSDRAAQLPEVCQ